jgi:hypothetical protein
MSVTAAIRRMLSAGLTIDQALIAAEAMEAELVPQKSAGAIRQQRYRERNKASQTVTSDACDGQVSPKKETSPTPPKEKTTPSQSETNVSSKNPRAALETVLDAQRAGDVIEMRQRIRKPLTVRAAELLAGQLAKWHDPNEAADAMVLNAWQGFKPEYLENQRARGSPKFSKPERPDHFKALAQELADEQDRSYGSDRRDWDDAQGLPFLTIDHQR